MFIINRANPEAQGDMFEYSEVIINRDLPSKIAKIWIEGQLELLI